MFYAWLFILIADAIKDRKKLFITPKFWSWFTLLLIGVSTYLSYHDNKEDGEKLDSTNKKADTISHKIDGQTATLEDVLYLLKQNNFEIKSTKKGFVLVSLSNDEIAITCPISIIISDTPKREKTELCNGETIPLKYKAKGLSVTIPYMVGKEYAGGFSLNNIAVTPIYDKRTGTFDLSKAMTGSFVGEQEVTFSANLTKQSEPTSKLISADKDISNMVTNDFFSKPITQISTSSQSYIIEADFTQNLRTKTVTFINGNVFRKGDKLLARR